MKRLILVLAMAALAMCGAGCVKVSHSMAGLAFGKVFEVGSLKYGRLLYVNGAAFLDLSRENSSIEVEINDEAGLSYDAQGKTLKGVKKIKRAIGHQATGYLKELAQEDTETAKEAVKYLKTDGIGGKVPSPEAAE